MNTINNDEGNRNGKRKWREWHEREHPIKIDGTSTDTGIQISIRSKQLSTSLDLNYPKKIWSNYPDNNKVKFLDNITYVFTAHLPFLLKGNIRLNYNTGYPTTYSWANQCFMRFLPAYWYLNNQRRGTKVFPMLKTILNSRAFFSQTKDVPPQFPETWESNVIIPFTFGKDSFLTYYLAKKLNLESTLVYFNEPTEIFAREHKLKLIKHFEKTIGEKIYFMDNPLGNLRELGEGWFGWELALTSWTLLSLPFAYVNKAAYVIFSNERSVNEFFYDDGGMKVVPDYEQSSQAIEELSLLTQSLSEGEVYTTTFLQGLHDLGIIGILKQEYSNPTFNLLMSCWAETEAAKNKRWCGECSKCARLYVYMTANGIDPIREAGFKDNMLTDDKLHLFNVFGQKASGTGWDAFGLNTQEQALAFYLTYLRGNREPLIHRFMNTGLFNEMKSRYQDLIEEYFGLHPENVTPPQWKQQIDELLHNSLVKVRNELLSIK